MKRRSRCLCRSSQLQKNVLLLSVRFGLSNRGHLVVHVGDHKFIKHECYRKKVRWTCSKRIQLGCRASITTHDSVIVRSFLEHNHGTPK
ncbi:hypothetical protein PYW08_016045 [Mythimna loreyi]|uniref:Uncharacterized protein n=1 Tax=Mythimna loreyi TaxID=667449 RepID=A0ACC2QUM7_9NEOP|nr:hypothetical protein PYW08_016045 [Mythimna loreyi]